MNVRPSEPQCGIAANFNAGICSMKTLATVLTCLLTASSLASSAVSADVAKGHPLIGEWTWTRKENSCTEVYSYRPDGTSRISSGEEVAETRFSISDKPDLNGFYRMDDEVTKDNGRTGCDGTAGGSAVGTKGTVYMIIRPAGDEMIICQKPSFDECFGPLRRVVRK
jgi:hypothetical protein